jgi:hypothetical protein
MSNVSREQSNDSLTLWLHFLSRWALATVLMGVVALSIDFAGVGFQASDQALGPEYVDLLQAVRSPALFRLFMTFDGLGWLMIGGSLIALAFVVRGRARLRAAFAAACGIGMLTGSLGGFMRLVGTGAIAAQYAVATPAQQAALLLSALTLYAVISAHFVAGGVLQGAGYLLVASAAFAVASFPRWLAGWFVLAGLLEFLEATTAALGAFSLIILLPTILIGVWGLHLAMAAAFWRPSPALLSATSAASAPA